MTLPANWQQDMFLRDKSQGFVPEGRNLWEHGNPTPPEGGSVSDEPRQPPAAASDAPLEQVLRLIRERRATTRPTLVDVTGLSRKVVIQRVDQLISMGLIRAGSKGASTARAL